MRNNVKRLLATTAVVAALAAAPALYAYAHTSDSPNTTDQGMMGNGGMMGGGSMKGMMEMMRQMGQMARNCNAMMTSVMTDHGMAPNEQPNQGAQPQVPEGSGQDH